MRRLPLRKMSLVLRRSDFFLSFDDVKKGERYSGETSLGLIFCMMYFVFYCWTSFVSIMDMYLMFVWTCVFLYFFYV